MPVLAARPLILSVAGLLLPCALLAGTSACEVTSSSSTSDLPADTEEPTVDTEQGCIAGGAASIAEAGAASGLISGDLSGIRCSPSTCLCTGLFLGGAGSSWRVWWDADFSSDGGSTMGNVGVLSANCYPDEDECRFQLDFADGSYYADTKVRFKDASLDDAERSQTYVSMTKVGCSGDTYTCTGDLSSGTGNVAVWDVAVQQR